ncbi:Major facilitator superfamily and Major facilitator superfamily domain, general substrate transporter-containing protein [Strongyloides ratti]|uniref:Major facilitator superfamily and Major facilitator superfamily domain, general substrate transporter-containing protein n=1 Tax=Strongyloides ratti TaxID=34506 RepID=A0A090LG70_STRRB|nr:Major facilitator superfamily and Major facilitator superfamily domain, general substrate transporter-containing protein [Strongyloides ratti]CEF68737.1 Major facilitator superfamily and Major facilitator superfamily domain, general substrate transporter-containing protein [Strongyloides ratti]
MFPFRYIILVITTLTFGWLLSNPVSFNFAIVCDESENANGTRLINYDSTEISSFFSVVAVGNIAGTIFLNVLEKCLSFKMCVCLYLILSAIATALCPFFLQVGYWPTMFLRFVQGIGWAMCLPGTGSVSFAWAPNDESTIFASVLTYSGQIGPMITMYLSGELCSRGYGTESIFYSHALLTTFFLIIFFIVYNDNPSDSHFVKKAEVAVIENDKEITSDHKIEPVPYKEVICHPVLAIANVTYFVFFWTMHLWLQYAAIYMHNVLKFDIATTGILTSAPYLVSLVVKFIIAYLSDKGTFMPQKKRLQFLHGITQFPHGIAFIVQGIFPAVWYPLDVICYTIQIIGSASTGASLFKVCQLISRQHFHFVMSIASFSSSLTLIVLPTVISFIMPNFELYGWRFIFLLIGFSTVALNSLFIAFMDVNAAAWTKHGHSEEPVKAIKVYPIKDKPLNEDK